MTPRQYLGRELARARVAAGYKSQQALADHLGFDRTVISKAESGDRIPSPDVLAAWCEACGMDLATYERMADFVRESDGALPGWFAPYRERERGAYTLRLWQPLIVSGLLQTGEYARALIVATGAGPDRVDELVAERLDRQLILDRANVIAVLDESVLHRLIGSPAIMYDQLTHVVELSERPNVSVQVVPASIGANAGLSGGFQLASSDGAHDTLLREAVEDITSETGSLTREAIRIFDLVRADALPRALSRDRIMEVANDKWKQ
jgi:transcriptional regulator with XRE-family HTH domain